MRLEVAVIERSFDNVEMAQRRSINLRPRPGGLEIHRAKSLWLWQC